VKTWELYRVATLIHSGVLHEYSRDKPQSDDSTRNPSALERLGGSTLHHCSSWPLPQCSQLSTLFTPSLTLSIAFFPVLQHHKYTTKPSCFYLERTHITSSVVWHFKQEQGWWNLVCSWDSIHLYCFISFLLLELIS
jgi:hypothetical protein